MEAYRSYLKGNYQRSSEVGVQKAIANYEKAVELDSSFIEAWYALGRTWMFSGLYWGVNPERVAWNNSKKCWEKVIELAEHHPEAKEIKESVENSLLWNYLFYEWDFNRLERGYVQGIDDPLGLKPIYELFTGRYKQSLKTIEEYNLRASERGRINGRMIPLKAGALFFLNQSGEAEKQLTEYDDILWDNPTYLTESAKWYYYLGNYDKSRKALNHLIEAFDESSPLILFLSAVNSYEDGSMDERAEAIKELEAKYKSQKSGSPGWYLSLYYAHTGDYESSMEWLQQSFQNREVEMVWLRSAPLFAPVRNDPRYLEIYRKVGFPVPPDVVPEDVERAIR